MRTCFMHWLLSCFLSCLIFLSFQLAANETIYASKDLEQCTSTTWDEAALFALKEKSFVVENQAERQALALQLLNCLASPNPKLRDGVAYEAFYTWLRAGLLDKEVTLDLFDKLSGLLTRVIVDENGVYQSFSVLVLSEVVRVDRVTPFLSDQQFNDFVLLVNKFLIEQRDYRGFDETLGWRHAIAHTADVLLQLTLNKRLTHEQGLSIINAIATQIAAHNEHFYIYGESKRLALPVIYNFLQGDLTLEEWQIWLNKVVDPAPLASWNQGYTSQMGLSKLHNTQSFLNVMFVLITNANNEKLNPLLDDLKKAIKAFN